MLREHGESDALQVFAVDGADTHRYFSVKTSAGQLDFTIPSVVTGTYHLLAYVQPGFMTRRSIASSPNCSPSHTIVARFLRVTAARSSKTASEPVMRTKGGAAHESSDHLG